jgi:hypothetical protein
MVFIHEHYGDAGTAEMVEAHGKAAGLTLYGAQAKPQKTW